MKWSPEEAVKNGFNLDSKKQLECRISVELGSFTEFKRGHLKVTSLSSFVIVFCCTSIEFEH